MRLFYNMKEELIERIKLLHDDVYDYIVNTEHCLFYWISNKEVQNFIKEYPEDFENRMYISILSVDGSTRCKIVFDGHPDGIDYIERYAVLETFRDSAKAHWMEWNGKVKEMQIAEKEKELAYFKKKVSEKEKELLKLKNKEE